MKEKCCKQKNHKGFTLIELLVVVLIIGILAAIALPQYRLARDKAEFSKLQTMTKGLADAYSRYFLVLNTYPKDIEDLDIDLPAGYTKTTIIHGNWNISCAVYSDFYCCTAPLANPAYFPDMIFCSDNNYKYQIANFPIYNKDKASIFGNKFYCVAPQNNTRGTKLCNNISGRKSFTWDKYFTQNSPVYASSNFYEI